MRGETDRRGKFGERSAETARLRATIAEQDARIRGMGARLARLRAERDSARHARDATIEAARAALAGREDEMRAQLAALRGSLSWRITRPLRAFKVLARWLAARRAPPPPASPTPASVPLAAQSGPVQRPPLDALEEAVANSGFFDESFYPGTGAALAAGVEPVVHYLREGERAGVAPSTLFDPAFYAARHADLRGADLTGLRHYVAFGHQEGRAARPAAAALTFPTDCIVPAQSTVLVTVGAGNRSGAVILALRLIEGLRAPGRNVVVLLFRDGPIAPALAERANAMAILPEDFPFHPVEIDAVVTALAGAYAPDYVIANGADTRYFVSALERAGLPVVALVHEFASTIRPRGSLDDLFQSASRLVFPSVLVAEAARAEYTMLAARVPDVLPPGAPWPSPVPHDAIPAPLPHDGESLLVVGVGAITPRAGVDLFVAAAANLARNRTGSPVRFVWIGEAAPSDAAYFDDLTDQVARAGVASSVAFADMPDDLAPILTRAEICFLPARLDGLPIFAIDAAAHGVPVVCFDQASTLAEMLRGSEGTRELVVPYLDVAAASRLIASLADDPARRARLATSVRSIAQETFDFPRYAARLDEMGRAAAGEVARARHDAALIARLGGFNPALYLGPISATVGAADAIARYLHASRLAIPRDRPRVGMLIRRPLDGFHPLIYAGECPDFDEAAGEDPLVHFLRAGRPGGRWTHRVIRPGPDPAAPAGLRVAVHGHFHYPELLEDLVPRLRKNRAEIDLFLTTTSAARAEALADIVARLDVRRATIAVTPNRGRDIGPLLSAWGRSMFEQYDLVGHVHGKRSPQFDTAIGEGWRAFLLERLIGGDHAMMDTIIAAFRADAKLGLVFPEEPHLNDWDQNRETADDLAARMNLPLPLPTHFDFPIGTMFWSRPAALRPLWDLALGLDDFPPEPLPIDGALPHALERLLPFAAAHAGFQYATTMVDGHLR